jgi:hypothetical protein
MGRNIESVFGEVEQIELERQREIRHSYSVPSTPRETERLQSEWAARKRNLAHEAAAALRERKQQLIQATKQVRQGKTAAAERNAASWDFARLRDARDRAQAKVQRALNPGLGETRASVLEALLAETDSLGDTYEKRGLYEAIVESRDAITQGVDMKEKLHFYDLEGRISPLLESLQHSDEQRQLIQKEQEVEKAWGDYIDAVDRAQSVLPSNPTFDEIFQGKQSPYEGLTAGLQTSYEGFTRHVDVAPELLGPSDG